MQRKITLLAMAGVFAISAMAFDDVAKVERSEPEYRTITNRVPYQECWNEQVPVHRNSTVNNGTVGGILGGVAGGILGHQVGGGNGKTAATVGGAIIGTLVGKNLAGNNNQANSTAYRTQKKCVTKYNETTQRRLIGYKNIAYYHGQRVIVISQRPMNQIRLHVNITPY